jgi:hypothetical protein
VTTNGDRLGKGVTVGAPLQMAERRIELRKGDQ